MRYVAVAIAVALVTAGTSTAAFVVTSANIKNGTIQPIDLSAKTKRSMRGVRGGAGPPGPPGEPGFQGPPGPRGDVGHVLVVTGSTAIGPNVNASATASCSGTGKLTGGGFQGTDADVAVYISRPSGQSWIVTAHNLDPSFSATLTVYALCSTSS